MYEKQFALRLAELRNQKGISARDMSLSIGQNPGYINNIETGKALPSMTAFFYICDYLNVKPHEFFEFDRKRPEEINLLISLLNQLSSDQLANITSIVKGLIK